LLLEACKLGITLSSLFMQPLADRAPFTTGHTAIVDLEHMDISGFVTTQALCLDLDGTVRRSKSGKPFVESLEDIELMPGIERLINIYRGMGWVICGVSNQGGVAHGYKTPDDVSTELAHTFSLFENNPFDVVKCCFFEQNGNVEPYSRRSLFRKPDIGMLALIEYECFERGICIDWDDSIFVGDREEDKDCAIAAGVTFIHIDDFLVSEITFSQPKN
jgi:D-glycero-D-manno-heptose 1,7-bisphosphate phosphatase